MRNFVLLLILGFATSGCATRFYIPTNRFQTPESSGNLWRGDIKIASAGVTQVQIADDTTSLNPDLTPILSRNSALQIGGSLGLASFLDLYANVTVSSPTFVGMKVQVLGNPAPGAKAGNVSLAILGGVATSSTKQNYDSSGVSGTSEMSFSGWEGAALLGYRWSENFLVYTGAFKSHVKTEATIKRTSNSITTVTAQPDGVGESSGAIFGVRWGNSIYISIEGISSANQWTRKKPTEQKADELNALVGGVAIGGAW
jgi:hypothetical protein